MGLMDRVKAQATQLAQKTQEAAQEGKARLDQAQANRRGDVLLRQLGAVVFAERTGRGAEDSQAKIDELISSISAHEREFGLNLSQTAPPTQSDSGGQPGSQSSYQPGQGTSYPPPGGDPGSSYQENPGGFGTGQTFFPPPDESRD
jgi:uncharacterized phage infection (PIP) family protein YhgE